MRTRGDATGDARGDRAGQRAARPAATSSTSSAARRTVRASGASAVASTSAMSIDRTRCDARRPAARSARSSQAARPPGTEAGQPGATERSQTSTSRSTWTGPPRRAGDLERLGHHVVDRPAVQLVAVDDRDAVRGRAARVGGRVGEVGDADLHDPAPVEPGLDQPRTGDPFETPSRRSWCASRVMSPAVASSVAPGAERRGHGEGVVAADRDGQAARRDGAPPSPRSPGPRPRGPSGSVTSPASAKRSALHVEPGHERRVAAQRVPHRGRVSRARRRRERGAPGRDAEDRDVTLARARPHPSAGQPPARGQADRRRGGAFHTRDRTKRSRTAGGRGPESPASGDPGRPPSARDAGPADAVTDAGSSRVARSRPQARDSPGTRPPARRPHPAHAPAGAPPADPRRRPRRRAPSPLRTPRRLAARARPSTRLYSVGSTTSVSSVDETRPPITTIASGCEMNPPWPVRPIAMGVSAAIVARAVIRMGRRRRDAPCATASRDGHAPPPVLVDQVDQHDRVRHHDADQHQHTDQRRDTERDAGDDLQEDRTGRRERHRDEQQQRLTQRPERRDHHDVDDQDGREQRDPELRERIRLAGGDAADLRRRARRQVGLP